jgi:hypothetical protein
MSIGSMTHIFYLIDEEDPVAALAVLHDEASDSVPVQWNHQLFDKATNVCSQPLVVIPRIYLPEMYVVKKIAAQLPFEIWNRIMSLVLRPSPFVMLMSALMRGAIWPCVPTETIIDVVGDDSEDMEVYRGHPFDSDYVDGTLLQDYVLI